MRANLHQFRLSALIWSVSKSWSWYRRYMHDLPIVCTLTPEMRATRKAELLPGLSRRAEATEPTRNGYSLRFAASGEVLHAVAVPGRTVSNSSDRGSRERHEHGSTDLSISRSLRHYLAARPDSDVRVALADTRVGTHVSRERIWPVHLRIG